MFWSWDTPASLVQRSNGLENWDGLAPPLWFIYPLGQRVPQGSRRNTHSILNKEPDPTLTLCIDKPREHGEIVPPPGLLCSGMQWEHRMKSLTLEHGTVITRSSHTDNLPSLEPGRELLFLSQF